MNVQTYLHLHRWAGAQATRGILGQCDVDAPQLPALPMIQPVYACGALCRPRGVREEQGGIVGQQVLSHRLRSQVRGLRAEATLSLYNRCHQAY